MLAISVLSVSVFGCYAHASSTDTSNSYDITEKQKRLYNILYGKNNWFVDEDGTVAPVKDKGLTSEQVRKKLDHFLVRIAIAAGYLGDYEQIYDAVDKIAGTQDKNTTDLTPQANNYLNKWFSQFDGAIDVGDDGNVTIKADAMQGFRNALSDQVYSLGSYRLLTANTTLYGVQKKIQDFCGSLPSGINSYLLKDNLAFFSGEYMSGSRTQLSFYFFNANYNFDGYSDYFMINVDFDQTVSKGCYQFYGYKTNNTIQNLNVFRDRYVNTKGYVDYFITPSGSYIMPASLRYLGSNFLYYGPTQKVFSSEQDAKYYYGILNDNTKHAGVYIYNNYSPTDINFNINNNYNYKNILNNAYNTVNNNKNSAIGENGSITEEELQKIIKDAIDAAIKETGGSNSGSGGSSGGSSGGGVSSDLLGSILEYVKKIYTICQTSDTRLETLVKVAQANQETFSDILGAVKDIRVAIDGLGVPLDNIEKYLKSINDKIDELLGGDDSGGSLFDRILDFLSRLTSDLLADLLGDVIKTVIGDLDSVTRPAKALADAAQSKFPTSIPWDIVAILGVMSADPECPKFEIPFSVPRLGINETIKIDLSDAEKVAELSRNMLTVTFLLFLVIQTRKIYGSMSKN